MSDSRRKRKHKLAAYATAAAVSAVVAIPLIHAQTMRVNSQLQSGQLPAPAPAADAEKPDAAPATATAPAPVAGEPGEAPRPPKPDDAAPGNQLERAADSGMQVFVDDSFGAVSQLQAARLLASQAQDQKAITAFQKIINSYGQKLVYLNNASYVSITDYVREQLLRMPAVKNGMYDQLYGAEAKMAIDPLVEKHDLAGLIRMCDRYFPSTAALDGLSQAAAWYFERGEFAGASRNWQLLMSHPMATPDMRALFLFRAAVSESLLGNATVAAALRARLAKEFPDATGIVDGQQTPLVAAADEIMAQPPLAVSAAQPDEWPGFQGGPAHTHLLDVNSSIEARLWNVDLHDKNLTGEQSPTARTLPVRANGPAIFINGQPQESDPNAQSLNAYPVISNGSMYVHTGSRIVSLSINGLEMLWAYPKEPIPAEISGRQQQIQNAYGYMVRMVSHDSVAIAGNEAFATLPAPAAPASDEPQRRVVYYGGFPGNEGNTRIVCLNRQTGKEIWSTSADTVKLEKPGALTFIGSPIVTQQGVFSMARKAGEGSFSELYLVRLDRQSGSPSWACYLCSASSGSYYQPMPSLMPIPIPTIDNDLVYISTGQGADCAVDANAGRILWLDITEAAKVAKDPRTMYQPNFNTTPSWKFNPPLVSGDRLVCCETSDATATMRIYDRWTGKLLRSIDKKELHLGSMDVLAGIIGSTAIVVGDKVVAVDIHNDEAKEPLWTADFEAGVKEQGRPFLASARLYVPFNSGLLTLDPRSGAQISFSPWPSTGKTDGHEVPIKGRPGNLLVTSEQVIVLNDEELAGYSKWETARDNRLRDIKDRPADPEAYLALAEISFRTKHYDLAQENMKRSVELASAAAAASGAAAPEILGRLYRINLDFAEQLLNDPDVKSRDLSRFYYEQCKLSARDSEQQAEWRLCMSELSLLQDKPDEAATLYSEVLTDPNLRKASFRRLDDLARAGVVAEDKFRALIARPGGPAIYKRFEDQAQSMLIQARANRDSKLLKQVEDGYPNSASAIAAATDLASAAREAHDIPGQLKALYWMLPRVNGDKLAAVTADIAIACLALPKPRYSSAIAWTERGLRQFKHFQWTDPDTHAVMTFASLRDKLRATPAAALVEGRLPVLPSKPDLGSNGQPKLTEDGKQVNVPDMQSSSLADPLALGTLLAPVEQSAALRRPDLLFTEHRGRIHIFDTARGVELTSPEIASGGGNIRDPGGLSFGNDKPAILLGCVGDTAIFAQSDAAIGINVKSLGIAWRVAFAGAGTDAAGASAQERMQLRAAQFNQGIVIANGMVIDRRTGQPFVNSPADPEAAREASFASLGRPAFSALRIVDDKLIAVTGDKISANSIAGGKLLWSKPIEVPGNVSVVLGNEDVIVAQVDTNNRTGSTFVTFDAGTGAFRKRFHMKDGERVEWRGISDDGVFFVATNLGLDAYSLLDDVAGAIWHRQGMTSTYPAATAVTLDGLMFLKDGKDLLCLSSETGDIIWPQGAPLDIGTAVANGAVQAPFIRSVVDGDSVIFQSPGSLKVYQTTKDVQEHLVWESAEMQPGDSPPMESFQVADPYVVVMEAGPKGNGMEHTVDLILYARDGGKMKLKKKISKNAGTDEGPNIFAWQVVDNGIAMETDRQPNDPNSGKVYFYHGNKPVPKPE